jgi:hypothetical protein
MEVTPEMRRAVAAEAAEAARRYERECAQRHAEWYRSMEDKLKAEVRKTLPDITDDEFDEIESAFSSHYYEINR